MSAPTADLTVVTDVAGLDALRDDWRAVFDRSRERSVFTSWEWARTWWRHFGNGDRLHLVVVREGPEPRAIAPLLETTLGLGRIGFRVLVPLGQETAGYGGFLLGAEPERTAPMILDHLDAWLRKGPGAVNLTRLRDDGDLLPILQARCADPRGRTRLECLQVDEHPLLDFTVLEDPAAHVARLWKRNDVRRRLRRLREEHDVEWQYRSPEPPDVALGRFLAVHDRRWAEKADTPSGLFASERGRRFLREVTAALDAAGWLRISFVLADGEVVVGRYGFELDGAYSGLKSGFDPAYDRFGPGHLAVGLLAQECVERGLHEFDFMRGAGEHKKPWANAERQVGYWALVPRRLGGVGVRLLWTDLRVRNRRRV